jgi:CBS domain-containing protein
MKSIRDVMTKNPKSVRRDEDLQTVARAMKDNDTGIIPVVDDSNKVIGVVTDRDIVVRCIAEGQNASDKRVSDVMSSNVRTVTEGEGLEKVFEMMSREQIRRVPVVGDNGELIGIVAQADLATRTDKEAKVGRTVEEISEPRGETRR